MTETLEHEKAQTFSIETLEASKLPELQGLKEKQLQIVKDNPFVEITDTATFEAAKKARTTLVSARTEIQNQDKAIASKIKKFREMVADVSEELISITRPHEEKQQEEVKRWEGIKEKERAEKQRIEDERKGQIKFAIETIINTALKRIDALTFELIDSLKVDFEQNLYKTDVSQFEEFELDFNEKLNLVKSTFAVKEKHLNELEAQRLEAERIAAEKKQLEIEKAEHAARVKADEEKAAAEQKRIQDEQKAQQEKIDAERRELEAEKQKNAKAEADKKAAEEADRLAAEKAEADRIQAEKEAARLEALKPEKEKAVNFLNALVFKNDLPEITDPQITELIKTFIQKVDAERNDLITLIENL